MKCKRPMAHRPAMEGVINCKACEREKIEELALTARRGMNGRLYFPWMWVWAKKEQE